jgi:DNA-binding NarL/FixJ family response regulator
MGEPAAVQTGRRGGLSNQRISAELYVSVGTVKTHLNNHPARSWRLS